MASNDSSNYDIKSLELCPNQSNGSLQLTVLWKHNATTGSDEGSLFLLSELKSKLAPTLGESKFKKMTANKGSELWGKIQQVKGPTVAKLVQAGVVRGGGTWRVHCVALQGLQTFLKAIPEMHLIPAVGIVGTVTSWGEHIALMLAGNLAHWESTKMYQCDGMLPQGEVAKPRAPSNNNALPNDVAEVETSAAASSTAKRNRTKYTLDKKLIRGELEKQLEECKKFWTNEIVPSRKQPNMRADMNSYLDNKEGWFLRFLGFVHQYKPTAKLSLSLFLDVPLFEEFLQFLAQRSGKGVAGGHLIGVCASAAVAACKFLTKDRSKLRNFRDIDVITHKYDTIMVQAKHQVATNERKGEGHTRKGWTTLKVLRAAWMDLNKQVSKPLKGTAAPKAKLQRARDFQKFTVMTMWLGLPPVRSAVIRTIQVTDGPNPHFNSLYWDKARGTFCIFVPKHKGPGKSNYRPPITIALPQKLFGPILKEFTEVHRPMLLQQQTLPNGAAVVPHRHLILNTLGRPFTKTNFSHFAKTQLWQKYTNVSMPAHLLRHIVVTDLGNRGVPESVWESYCFMMGHTRQTQQTHYNLMTQADKTVAADKDMQDWTSVMVMDLDGPITNDKQGSGPPQQTNELPTTLNGLVGQLSTTSAGAHTISEQDNSGGGESLWGVQRVLKRQLSSNVQDKPVKDVQTWMANMSKKQKCALFEVLVDWEPTWEPLNHLSKSHQQQAMKLKLETLPKSVPAKKKARSC